MKRETIVMLILIGIALRVAGEHFSRQTAFDKRFEHMTSFSEVCENGVLCPVDMPRWTSDLWIGFFNASQVDKQDTIRRRTMEYGRALTHLTTVDMQIINAQPNVVFISFDRQSNDVLAEAIPPFLGFPGMAKRLNMLIRAQNCGGTLFTEEATSPDTINTAFVYINVELKDEELDACILEELVGTHALLNDPPGQASLFDYGNFSQRNGRIWISPETEAMLMRIYEEQRR